MNALIPPMDRPLVLIVDDDDEVRLALEELMFSVGLEAMGFASTRGFLASAPPDRVGCLILDVRLPGLSGLDLQRQLVQRGAARPIIFLTAYADIPMTVEAMKAGAVDFLVKPVCEQTLLDSVSQAIALDRRRRAEAARAQSLADRYAALTPREREVFHRVAAGRLGKQIAFELGISEATVKLHRRNLLRKLACEGGASLARLWTELPADLQAPAS